MRKLTAATLFALLILMLLAPKTASGGALNGLTLWAGTLLPILLPFLIVSGLIVASGLTSYINRILSPALCRIFPVSPNACYPLVLGLLCGMPLGAKTTADLYRRRDITYADAMFLLSLSNQASMMFIVSYVAAAELDASAYTFAFLSILYISAWIVSVAFRPIYSKGRPAGIRFCAAELPTGGAVQDQNSFFALLDRTIADSFATITRIGGYIILFSMLAAFVSRLPLPPAVSALLGGCLEITGGIHAICACALPAKIKTALVLGVTAFGGLSGLMQTKSVTLGTGLSIKFYLILKILQGIVCFLLTYLLLCLISF